MSKNGKSAMRWYGVLIAGAIIGALAGYALSFLAKPQYHSATIFVPEGYQLLYVNMVPKINSCIEGEQGLDPEADAINPALYPDIVASKPFLDTLAARHPEICREIPADANTAEWLRKHTDVAVDFKTLKVSASASTHSPLLSMQLCNAIVKELERHVTEYRRMRRAEKLAALRMEADSTAAAWRNVANEDGTFRASPAEVEMLQQAYADAIAAVHASAGRLAEVRKPFTMIEFAEPAPLPHSPRRPLWTLAGALAGLGIPLIFYSNHLAIRKEE